MEHLLQKSKCFIFHNIFKYMIFQRRQKALLWSKGLKYGINDCLMNVCIVYAIRIFLVDINMYHKNISFFFSSNQGLNYKRIYFVILISKI